MLAVLAAASPIPQISPAQARASVRIIRAARVTPQEWEKLPPQRRREVIRHEGGRPVKIRLIEFE